MRQLLVECSDPGLVVSLAEEFEHVLRQVDFDRAKELRGRLAELARELGPEYADAWEGFRVELPNDGDHPLTYGNRGPADEKCVKALLEQAGAREIGRFEVRHTMLLPQGGPEPETREQYIENLADGIRWSFQDEAGIRQLPNELPAPMAAHREKVMAETAGSVLRGRAHYPGVGHRWVEDSLQQLRKALEEVATRAEAVMLYELERLDPAAVAEHERLCWTVLAARLGREVPKWYAATEGIFTHLYQRVALAYHVWTDARPWGPTRGYLEERFSAYLQAAEGVYTADAVAAIRRIHDELRRPPWGNLWDPLPAQNEDAEEDNG